MGSALLKALFTDSEGNIATQGSEEDHRLLGVAIKNVEDLEISVEKLKKKLSIAVECLEQVVSDFSTDDIIDDYGDNVHKVLEKIKLVGK